MLHPALRIPFWDTFPSATSPASLSPQHPPRILPILDSRFLPVLVLWFCFQRLFLSQAQAHSLKLVVSFPSVPLCGCCPPPPPHLPHTPNHENKDFVYSSTWTASGPRSALGKHWEELSEHTLLPPIFHLIPEPKGCTQALICSPVWPSHSLTDISLETNSRKPLSAHKSSVHSIT